MTFLPSVSRHMLAPILLSRVVIMRIRRFAVVFCAVLALALGMVAPAFARGAPDSFADLSARLLPTVVGISSSQVMRSQQKSGDFSSRLQDMFRKAPAKGGVRRISSVGSGFIIDAGGYIITNNHVVEGADKIEVSLNNGETLQARLIGRDEKTDLALIKVDSKKALPYARFGDSNRARIGEWVIAIGNPFGLGSTVTAGIISARNRNIQIGDYDDFIQTDAPINKGNSGGPLFDMDGSVIGVNSAIFSPSGGSVGIGFAIPSNMVRDVIGQLRQFGMVHRGWVGLNIRQAENGGALVTGVAKNGPAAKAGLRNGDIVTGYDGRKVSDSRDLARQVAMTAAGRTVAVEVQRGKARLNLRLTIQPLKSAAKNVPAIRR